MYITALYLQSQPTFRQSIHPICSFDVWNRNSASYFPFGFGVSVRHVSQASTPSSNEFKLLLACHCKCLLTLSTIHIYILSTTPTHTHIYTHIHSIQNRFHNSRLTHTKFFDLSVCRKPMRNHKSVFSLELDNITWMQCKLNQFGHRTMCGGKKRKRFAN